MHCRPRKGLPRVVSIACSRGQRLLQLSLESSNKLGVTDEETLHETGSATVIHNNIDHGCLKNGNSHLIV